MKNVKNIILTLLVLGTVFAGDKSKLGTTSAGLFQLNTDARGVALSGAHASGVLGATALNYNPAGLSGVEGFQLHVGSMNYIAETSITEAILAFKMDEAVLAFRGRIFSSGDIAETTNANPYGTGNDFSFSSSIFSVAYAQKFTETIRFGVNFNFYSESDLSNEGSAMSIDMGIQYKLSDNFDFGVSIKNVGTNVTYSTTENKIYDDANTPYYPGLDESNLPVQFQISTSYKNEIDDQNSVNLYANFVNNNSGLNDVLGGLEYSYDNMFYVRAGYNGRNDKYSAVSSLSYGAGLDFDLGDGSKINFGYAVRTMREDALDDVHLFNVILNF